MVVGRLGQPGRVVHDLSRSLPATSSISNPGCPGVPSPEAALTAAVTAVVQCSIGACEIVDKLVLPNKEGALGGDGIIDGSREVSLGAVEGAYPATVNAQLWGSRGHGEQVTYTSDPTACLGIAPVLIICDRGTPGALAAHLQLYHGSQSSPSGAREGDIQDYRHLGILSPLEQYSMLSGSSFALGYKYKISYG